MAFDLFHFLQPAWLWGLLAIPLVMLVNALLYRGATPGLLLERFADRHLLPHLIKRRSRPVVHLQRPFLLWAAAWACGMLAMAGPTWNYTDQQTFKAAENLVIVLDLSQGMNEQDVKPSRVARAREEIQDLLDLGRGTDIGLIAYAAVPHMVTPLTDDVRTIENLLPALDTSLVTVQGDRLQPALEMAARMLKAEPGTSNSILVISDGAFEENDFASLARAADGAAIYTMGIGTAATGMQAGRLQQLAAAGHGLYVEANYSDSDTRALLARMDAGKSSAQMGPASIRAWEDRFYIPLLVLVALVLLLFRRQGAFAALAVLMLVAVPMDHARAAIAADLFLNKDQQALAAFDRKDYKNALSKFDTDYRRGVVAYRAGRYDKAAEFFQRAAKKNNDVNALYDLGNAQLMQFHPQDAVNSYEAVLKKRPGDIPTEHNLAIARKMLEQKKQKDKNNNKDDKNDKSDQDKKNDAKKQNQQQGGAQNKSSNKSQAANQGKPGNPQQAKPGQQPPSSQGQNGQQAPGHQGSASPASQANAKPGSKGGAAGQRRLLDVNSDQWLNRMQSDPGSFLRNQFLIEERQSVERQ